METMDGQTPIYETLALQNPPPLEATMMMSRLNWMTYMKVLFDKLVQNGGQVTNEYGGGGGDQSLALVRSSASSTL
jgi:hypothetical protein